MNGPAWVLAVPGGAEGRCVRVHAGPLLGVVLVPARSPVRSPPAPVPAASRTVRAGLGW